MFKAGEFRNPHDQRYYDEELRVEKLHEVVDQNTEYFIDEMEFALDDYLDYILDEAIRVRLKSFNEYENEYIEDEIKKKIKKEYKLDLVRR